MDLISGNGCLLACSFACLLVCFSFDRGWNYVRCIEQVVWGNSFHEHPKECWKMTALCRDVTSTGEMDEMGHGMTTRSFFFHSVGNGTATVLALISGLVASLMICHALRGGFSKRKDRYDGVEFSEVQTHELM